MTSIKYLFAFLGFAAYASAQVTTETNQVLEAGNTAIENMGSPTIVNVDPAAEAPKPQVKPQPQQPTFVSRELTPVPVSKSVMLLSLQDDDPADAPDPRDGEISSRKKADEPTGGMPGSGFLPFGGSAGGSGDDANANSGSKGGPLRIGLHFASGWITTKTGKEYIYDYYNTYYDRREYEKPSVAVGGEIGIIAKKTIAYNIFVSTGVFGGISFFKYHGNNFNRWGEPEGQVNRYKMHFDVNVPVAAGYQIANMVNIEMGPQFSYLCAGKDKIYDDYENLSKEFSTGFMLGASFQIGSKSEIGFKMNLGSQEKLYALSLNFWLK